MLLISQCDGRWLGEFYKEQKMIAQPSRRSQRHVTATAPTTAPQATTHTRLAFFDNVRWALTALVVLHHLSITYGASGSWYYVEEPINELAAIVLTLFTALNQGYFMGLFFLIAGFFTPAALERKGFGGFLHDRLVRLGLPLLIVGFLINPTFAYFLRAQLYPAQAQPALWQQLLQFDFAPGPLWFVEALLIFSLVYALGAVLWKQLHSEKAKPKRVELTNPKLLALALLIIGASFATRLAYPIGSEWHNFQLGFFPQYIVLFGLGIAAYRYQWLPDLPMAIRRPWAIIVGVALVALPVMMATLGTEIDLAVVFGGWHWQAFAFAVWEAFYGLAMSLTLLGFFRRRFDRQTHLTRALSSSAYTVYIIHAPVVVTLTLLARDLHLHPLLKFALLAAPAVILCFALAYLLVQYLPGARRVL